MVFDTLAHHRVTIADHVAEVTIAHPPVNAQNDATQDELIHIMDCLSDRDDIRVVILTGEGRAFCAGVDIKTRAGKVWAPGERRHTLRGARESYHAVRECTKPVIGAINGAALGAGLAIVASCDILIAAEEASLGLPEVTVGLMGGCRHAMQLFGRSRVRRMMANSSACRASRAVWTRRIRRPPGSTSGAAWRAARTMAASVFAPSPGGSWPLASMRPSISAARCWVGGSRRCFKTTPPASPSAPARQIGAAGGIRPRCGGRRCRSNGARFPRR